MQQNEFEYLLMFRKEVKEDGGDREARRTNFQIIPLNCIKRKKNALVIL
jgi:hypothetical protein